MSGNSGDSLSGYSGDSHVRLFRGFPSGNSGDSHQVILGIPMSGNSGDSLSGYSGDSHVR